MSKNKKSKVRRSWGNIKPATKVKESDKIYTRKKLKRDINEMLKEYKKEQP